ncbi:YacP-like NYN domain-containing protein [Schleiferilactobacillus harbinensis]|jgi:predicted RNA-binding protein with PIN domain|uniref:YacP-like NYN domain-containing protein n=1 Tax=Schleiferilactobacillus harbinensis TaxID=304207 RepID=UPI0024312512|nr:NYN domain-containing protein [Schleiferilactobacillus harbinensis]MCI1688042.1 NYN domain-containing protein [Schleiferilactobacillus harbinensis]MCI1782414.1 NYN domain-containing protein [Schleiferilactobacillus harbinensis]MCI1852078.1 NYN domain-containing protein [Schleiferilactobacillus harbinensis]
MRHQIIIVDGYNVIGSWPELTKLKEAGHFDQARDRLLDILSEYHKFIGDVRIIVIFDAMYVPGIKESFTKWDLEVTFTPEDETADSYIEHLTGELNTPLNQVTVVTSDQAEQWTVFSRGALRISSPEFGREINRMRDQLAADTKHFAAATPRNVPWRPDQMLSLGQFLKKLIDKRGHDDAHD